MQDIRTILVATDLSEFSGRAGTRAAMLCASLNWESIELLNVKEGGLPNALGLVLKKTPAMAETVLADRAMRELRLICGLLQDNHAVRCDGAVRFGRPEAEIVAGANELAAKLTVIGAHGGNFFTDLFLGNTADKLARMSKTPLLVVKNQPTEPYRRVLVPVDFSENSKRAAQMALEIAPYAHVTFLHVFDVVLEEQMQYLSTAQDTIHDYHVSAAEEARRNLNEFIEGLQVGQDAAHQTGHRSFFRAVAFGHPGHVIYDHSKAMKADLVVMGKHGWSHFEALLLGSVSRHVIEQCFCDVLIVAESAQIT